MELDPILYEGGEGQSPPGISGVMTVEIDCKKQFELQIKQLKLQKNS